MNRRDVIVGLAAIAAAGVLPAHATPTRESELPTIEETELCSNGVAYHGTYRGYRFLIFQTDRHPNSLLELWGEMTTTVDHNVDSLMTNVKFFFHESINCRGAFLLLRKV